MVYFIGLVHGLESVGEVIDHFGIEKVIRSFLDFNRACDVDGDADIS